MTAKKVFKHNIAFNSAPIHYYMRKIHLVWGAILLLLCCASGPLAVHAAKPTPTPLRLWYDQPAANWNEALPLGNGRLGTMVFGGPARERLQLNEETIWAGGPNNNVKSDALPVIQQLRTQLLAGQLVEAQALAQSQMQPADNSGMPYQMAANVYLNFPGHDQATAYQRDLDISRAVASVSYQVGGISYRREVFSSLPDQVIIVRLTASRPGSISCQLSAESLMQHIVRTENDQLVLDGRGSEHEGQEGKIRFQTRVRAVAEGGTVQTTAAGIRVERANSATLYISIGTNFNNYHDVSGNAAERATAYLAKAVGKPYKQALADHVAAYQRYFNRVTLNLGRNARGPATHQ